MRLGEYEVVRVLIGRYGDDRFRTQLMQSNLLNILCKKVSQKPLVTRLYGIFS